MIALIGCNYCRIGSLDGRAVRKIEVKNMKMKIVHSGKTGKDTSLTFDTDRKVFCMSRCVKEDVRIVAEQTRDVLWVKEDLLKIGYREVTVEEYNAPHEAKTINVKIELEKDIDIEVVENAIDEALNGIGCECFYGVSEIDSSGISTVTAEDLEITDAEYKELQNNEGALKEAHGFYVKNPYCFEVYDNAKEFGASDPDNDLRESETDEEWAEFLYGAYLERGNFVFKFTSGRYLVATA